MFQTTNQMVILGMVDGIYHIRTGGNRVGTGWEEGGNRGGDGNYDSSTRFQS